MKKRSLFIAGLLLSACAAPIAITTAPAQYQRLSGFNQQFHRGDTVVTIRAQGMTANGTRQEVQAPCTFENASFRVSFTTPAKVITPNLGEATTAARLSCRHNAVTETVALEPINLTVARIRDETEVYSDGSLVGVLVAGVAEGVTEGRALGGRDPARDEYGYLDHMLRIEAQ